MDSKKLGTQRPLDNIQTIERIDFFVYGNNEVLRNSVIKSDPVGISIPEGYNNFEPVHGGVIDKRLGITDNYLTCDSCGENTIKCPGHFGHIKLVEAVFHIGYLQVIKSILSCVCIKCSKLLIYKNEQELSKIVKSKTGKKRFNLIRNVCKHVTYCQKDNFGCGAPVPKILVRKNYENIYVIAQTIRKVNEQEEGIMEGRKKIERILSPDMCYDILRNISDADCVIMGFDPKKSRPEDMIIKIFPVPPVQMRPSVKLGFLASATKDDHLTLKLADIVKTNQRLRKNKEAPNETGKNVHNNDISYLLQYHIATYFDNPPGPNRAEQRNGEPIKSLSERLKGKEGHIRGNMMGKRVDMSGRTVITSDPNINVNEVGIPLKIAMNLTFPEIVMSNNIEHLTQLVRNGWNKYPGANFVTQTTRNKNGTVTKRVTHLKYNKYPIRLQPGDVIDRHLINGDIVLFNRQPSLHKLSMMGHIVHVLPLTNLSTFRMNVSVTTPYNAD
jgi:DNA-directed RNA polymerase II subunit RPB1